MRRSFVRIVIGLISANAAIAVFVLLSGDIGETEGRILGTSLLATATAVLGMVCAPALSAGRRRPIPLVGMAAALGGFVLVTTAIWGEIDSVWFGKTAGSAYLVAGAAALASLLSAWPVGGRAAWVGTAGGLLLAAATIALLAGMWFEVDSPGFWRVFAVLAVLLAATSLAIPILHRAGSSVARVAIADCPFCGSPIEGTTDTAITCPTCGRRFLVHLV